MKSLAARAVIAALVVLVACWAGSAQQGVPGFGGFFETTIEINQTDSVTVKDIALNSALALGEWVVSADASFSDAQFDALTLYVDGPLGPIDVNSSLVVNPSTLSFVSWQTGLSFTLGEMAFSDVFYVTTPRSSSYSLWTVSGSIGDLSLQGTFKTGICPLCFWEARLCAGGPWPVCDIDLELCVQLTDTGFQSATASMTGLTVFEEVLGVTGHLDATVTFTEEEKTFSPTLRLRPEWLLCVDIELLGEISVADAPLGVTGAVLYGVVGELALDNGMTFTFAESLSKAKNSSVTGNPEYWEMLSVTGPLPSCCDDAGEFALAAYFGGDPPTPGGLFSLGLVTAEIKLRPFEGFEVAFDVELPPDTVGWQLTAVLRVFW